MQGLQLESDSEFVHLHTHLLSSETFNLIAWRCLARHLQLYVDRLSRTATKINHTNIMTEEFKCNQLSNVHWLFPCLWQVPGGLVIHVITTELQLWCTFKLLNYVVALLTASIWKKQSLCERLLPCCISQIDMFVFFFSKFSNSDIIISRRSLMCVSNEMFMTHDVHVTVCMTSKLNSCVKYLANVSLVNSGRRCDWILYVLTNIY